MTSRYRAVVFDLDGVLWDGEPLYREAFNVVLRPLGHEVAAGVLFDYFTQSEAFPK